MPCPVSANMPSESTCVPGPRLFGANASWDLFARLSYQLSNNLEIDWRADDNLWFLDWFSLSADFVFLRSLFSIKTPTVSAVYERLCKVALDLYRPALARVLFEIKDAIDNNHVMLDTLLLIAVRVGSRADGMLDLAKRAFEHISPPCILWRLSYLLLVAAARRDMGMMRLLIRAFRHSGIETEPTSANSLLLARVIRQLYNWIPNEPNDDGTFSEYIQLLIQGGILSTSISARCYYDNRPNAGITAPGTLTPDELVMMCPSAKRRQLCSAILRWTAEHRLFLSNAGIFTASVDGAHNLLAYLQSFEQKQTRDIQATLQECLVFAASLNDIKTASVLLELGADPEAALLSSNRRVCHKGMLPWNPMITAAAAGNLEMLQLLEDKVDLMSFVKSAPVYEIVQGWDTEPKYASRRGRELCRMEQLQRHYQHSKSRTPDAELAEGILCTGEFDFRRSRPSEYSPIEKESRIDTLTWIRNIAIALGVSQSFDKELIGAAVCASPESRVARCRNSSYHPCDVLLLDGLVDANLDYQEADMDLHQLSIRAQCSLRVVEFLLSKGFYVHSRASAESGNTMLHDALLSNSDDRSRIVQLLIREGANYQHRGEGLTILEASLERRAYKSQKSASSDLEIFTSLFEAGASVQQPPRLRVQGQQPLIGRLISVDAEDSLILRVLEAGATLNGRGKTHGPGATRQTPLEAAIAKGRETLALELIRRGADVHTPADESRTHTALQTACYRNCSLHFIECLITEHGADVNEAPAQIEGCTALQAAASCGSSSVTEMLLAHGADVNEASSHHLGFTALQRAASCGSLSVAEMLLAHGADVNALGGEMGPMKNFYGDPWTKRQSPKCRALDCAAMAGRLDMVDFLLKAGGRSGAAGLGGAIAIAKRFCRFAILSVLLDWEKEHGSRLIVEEVERQQQAPASAPVLLESDDDFSGDISARSRDALRDGPNA